MAKSSWEEDYKAYLEKYARDYCNGNVEIAEKHLLVQEVKHYYEMSSKGIVPSMLC